MYENKFKMSILAKNFSSWKISSFTIKNLIFDGKTHNNQRKNKVYNYRILPNSTNNPFKNRRKGFPKLKNENWGLNHEMDDKNPFRYCNKDKGFLKRTLLKVISLKSEGPFAYAKLASTMSLSLLCSSLKRQAFTRDR